MKKANIRSKILNLRKNNNNKNFKIDSDKFFYFLKNKKYNVKIIGGYYCQGLFKHVYKNNFPISYNYYDEDGNNKYDERANKRNKIIERSRMRILFNILGREKGLKLGTKADINQILISVGY